MRYRSLVLIVCCLFTLVACVQQRPGVTDIACDAMTAHGLAELRGQQKTPVAWQQTIAAAARVPVQYSSNETKIGDRQQTNTYYEWQAGDAEYTLITVDGVFVFAMVYFSDYQREPALASVLACLGQPDAYSIHYGQMPDAWYPYYDMTYFYTSRGVVLKGAALAPTLHTQADLALLDQPLTANTRLSIILWVNPGEVRELDWHSTNPTGGTEDVKRKILSEREAFYAQVRPWPGLLELAQVTEIAPGMMPPAADESPLPTPAAP